MFSAADFRAVVSGQRRDARAALLRAVLRVAEVPYTLAVARRNHGYDRQIGVERERPSRQRRRPHAGRHRKTPLVAGPRAGSGPRLRVTLISRGYAAEQGARNEGYLSRAKTARRAASANPDRVAAASTAVESSSARRSYWTMVFSIAGSAVISISRFCMRSSRLASTTSSRGHATRADYVARPGGCHSRFPVRIWSRPEARAALRDRRAP